MDPLSPDQITGSFVNASRLQTRAATPPAGLAELDWSTLDFLGWRDRRNPSVAYLVAPHGSALVGLVLRRASAEPRRGTSMCNLCSSAQQAHDVSLFVAPKA